MAGVGILCFAASYAVALCLEISRIFFRSSVRNIFSLFWVFSGLTAHTAYLYYHHAVSLVGINSAESYFLVSAWGVVLVYLYLSCFRFKISFGLIFLPITLLLIGGASLVSGNSIEQETVNASTLWKRMHAGTFFLATLSVCIGFVAGILYLTQDRRLRLKRPVSEGLPLPTIEWSLSICRQAIGASIFLLGASIFSGLLLHAIGPNSGNRVSFYDPLIVGTILMFVFLMFFSGILSLKLFKTEGRYVALLTLLSFLFLICMLFFAVFMQTSHWKRSNQQTIGKTVTNSLRLSEKNKEVDS